MFCNRSYTVVPFGVYRLFPREKTERSEKRRHPTFAGSHPAFEYNFYCSDIKGAR